MKIADIKRVLKPLGVLQGCNFYVDEPTSGFNYVYVTPGRGADAIAALRAAGADAMRVPACSAIYSDPIQVRRV